MELLQQLLDLLLIWLGFLLVDACLDFSLELLLVIGLRKLLGIRHFPLLLLLLDLIFLFIFLSLPRLDCVVLLLLLCKVSTWQVSLREKFILKVNRLLIQFGLLWHIVPRQLFSF